MTGNVAQLGQTLVRHFVRDLGVASGDAVDVCRVTAPSFAFQLVATQTESSNSFAKVYRSAVGFNNTGNTWRRLVPVSSSGPSSGNDFAVDILVVNSQTNFRLVRTQAGPSVSPSNIACVLQVYQDATRNATIVEMSDAWTGATNDGVFRHTLVTQTNSRVGVGTDQPAAQQMLHVAGNVLVSSDQTGGNAILRVDAANTRLGVGGIVPAFTLDVAGGLRGNGEVRLTGLPGTPENTGNVVQIDASTGLLSSRSAAQPGPLTVPSIAVGDDVGVAATGHANLEHVHVRGDLVLSGPVTGASVTSEPQSGSTALITSGGVFTAISGNVSMNALSVDKDIQQTSGAASLGPLTTPHVTVSGNVSAQHLSGSLLTAAQPLVTSLGNLTSLTVAPDGVARLDNMVVRSFQRFMAAGTNGVDICELSHQHGAYHVELSLVQAEAAETLVKAYKFVVAHDATGGEWRRLLPLTSSGAVGGKDLDVDIRSLLGTFTQVSTTTLRVARTAGDDLLSSANIECTLLITESRANPVGIASTTAVYATPTNAGLYQYTPLTQVGDRVGVNKANPTHPLHVTGSASIEGQLYGHSVGAVSRMDWDDAGVTLRQGAYMSWNEWIGMGESTFVNKAGTGPGGFSFYNSPGSGDNVISTNRAELMRVTPSAYFLHGASPIQFKKLGPFSGGSSVDTGFKAADWHPSISQFHFADGDIQETGTWDILRAYFWKPSSGDTWQLFADFVTHNNNDEPRIVCMFVSKSMTNQDPNAASLKIMLDDNFGFA
jgi:hypothetical protein